MSISALMTLLVPYPSNHTGVTLVTTTNKRFLTTTNCQSFKKPTDNNNLYSFVFFQIEDDDVSRSLKRRAIDALHMRAQAAEEKCMIYQEMRTVTEHLHQQHTFLCTAIKDTEQPGAKAALIQRLQQLERKLHQDIVIFHPHVPDIVPADSPYLCQSLPMSSIQTLLYNEDGDNDDNEDDDDN